MEIPNAFIGKSEKPAAKEVFAALAATAKAWMELIAWAEEQGVDEQEWKSSSAKYGWSLLLKRKKRTIVYLSPCQGCFRVSLVLGDKAVKAALQSGLPKKVAELVDEAPRYAEGTGVRLVIKGQGELGAIRKLVAAKLAN